MTERITAMGFEEVLIGYSLELCGRATRMMLEARADSDQPGGRCVGSPKEGRTPSTGRATTNRSAPPVGPPGSPPPIPCTPGAGGTRGDRRSPPPA